MRGLGISMLKLIVPALLNPVVDFAVAPRFILAACPRCPRRACSRVTCWTVPPGRSRVRLLVIAGGTRHRSSCLHAHAFTVRQMSHHTLWHGFTWSFDVDSSNHATTVHGRASGPRIRLSTHRAELPKGSATSMMDSESSSCGHEDFEGRRLVPTWELHAPLSGISRVLCGVCARSRRSTRSLWVSLRTPAGSSQSNWLCRMDRLMSRSTTTVWANVPCVLQMQIDPFWCSNFFPGTVSQPHTVSF